MATRTIADGGGNWSSTATWVEGAVPTNADEVVATGTSGQLTIDTAAVCRSINLTGYVNTLTINNANSLAIGDATLPTGSVALLFPTGMTVACNTPTLVGGLSTGCGPISFVSTAVGVQTVDFNSDNVGQVGSVTFDGVGGSWQLVSTLNTGWWNTVTLTRGTLDFNGQTCDLGRISSSNSNTRTMTLGAAQIHLHTVNPAGTRTWEFDTVTNLTFTANTATVTITQEQTSGNNLIGTATFNYNGLSVIMDGMGALHTTTTGTATFANFTVRDTAVPDDARPWYTMTRYQVNTPVTVTGSLTFMGYDSGRRLRVQTNSGTSLRTFGVTGATVSVENVDFLAISFNVAQDFSTANAVGNEGANTNITFPTGATQYFYAPGTGYKRWSYPGYWFLGSGGTGGAGRCPLPQDTVRFDSASFDSPGVTVVCDTPRIGGGLVAGGGIDWTGVTNNPTWHFQRSHICYGDMILDPNMSLTSTRVASLSLQVFSGTNVFEWTTAGNTWPLPVTFNMSSGNTVQLQDDITIDAVTGYLDNNRGTLTSSSGGLDCNNFNVTCNTLSNASGLLTMGSGTFTLTGRGTVWSSGGTISAGTSLIRITNNTRQTKTFSGNGRTYNNIELVGTVQQNYNFSGSNTFNDFKSSNTAPHKILFTAGTTTTVTTFDVNGDASNRIVIKSITTAGHTLTKAGGGTITCDYVVVERSTATPAATWSVTNGVDGGNNSGWSGFTSDPFTWTGATDSNFSVGTNWFGGSAPGASDLAFFHTNNVACTLDAAVNVRGIYLLSNYTSTVTQAATLTLGSLGWFQTGASTFTGATQAIANAGDLIQLAGTFTPSSGGTTFNSSTQDQLLTVTAAYNVGNVVVANSGNNRLLLLSTFTLSGVGQDLTINAGSMMDNNGQSLTVNDVLTVDGYWRSSGADTTAGSKVINSATSTIELSGGGTIVLDTAFAASLFNLILTTNKTITITGGVTLTINGTISPGTADMFNAQATPNRGQCQLWSTIPGVMWKLNLQGTSTLGPAIDVQDCDARYGNWFECKGSCYLLSHVCKHQGNYRCIEKPLRAGRIFRSHKNGHFA